jgi:hypothetical protein
MFGSACAGAFLAVDHADEILVRELRKLGARPGNASFPARFSLRVLSSSALAWSSVVASSGMRFGLVWSPPSTSTRSCA